MSLKFCINQVGILAKNRKRSITGIKVGPELSLETKVWRIMSSMGNIALACNYATVIYDIMVKNHNYFL
jgi:hypothetical protein